METRIYRTYKTSKIVLINIKNKSREYNLK